MMSAVQFPHERLQVYQVACEFLAEVASILDALPRGEGQLADQLKRASDSVLLNLCEGAGRTSWNDKGRFYEIARGSGTECAGVLAVVAIRRLAAPLRVEQTRALLHRVVSMLSVLARVSRRRATEGG